jgi:phenylalanine ammonia-lyase
VTWFLSPI